MSRTRIWSDINLAEEGAQRGFLRLATSEHDSAYGTILIPIVSIRNGNGPRVVIVAGNHGDEYEGQIAVMKLMRGLVPNDVRGQIILLSALNAPAAFAGKRTSPFDGGNLNRLFPGDPDGAPTSAIAHYFETVLLPGADLVIDLHSGGSSLEYCPSAVFVTPSNPEKIASLTELLNIFGFPVSFFTDAPSGGNRSLAGACERAGDIPCLSTELGGGATISVNALKLAEAGIRRVLGHIGVLQCTPDTSEPEPIHLYHRVPFANFVFSPCAGVFEPFVQVGETVEKGALAGAIHDPTEPWATPYEVRFEHSGIVLCRRFPARTLLGDCLFNLGISTRQRV